MPRSVVIILGFCWCLINISCLKTRTPDDPSQKSSNYVPPTEPSLVFQNMVNSFRDKNVENYLRSFADNTSSNVIFSFEPTPQAELRYSGVFIQWKKESEKEYFNAMNSKLNAGSVPTLEFQKLTQQSISTDSTQYEAEYILTVPHTQSNVPTQAKGKAQFFLVSDRLQNWVIRRWIDIAENQDDFTWSELKGVFSP